MPFAATWLGPTDSHTEWSRLEREWQIWYCLYVESKTKKLYEWAYMQNIKRPQTYKTNLYLPKGKGGQG